MGWGGRGGGGRTMPNATLSAPEWPWHSDGQRREPFYGFISCEGQSVKDKVHRPQFLKREAKLGIEPTSSTCQPSTLPLGQTGSHSFPTKDR